MKTLWVISFLVAISCCLSTELQAAAGDLDPLFATVGFVSTDISSTSDEGRKVVLQPDGKIIVAGNALGGGGQNNVALVRYNPNGSLDPTFGTGGIVTTTMNVSVGDVALQADSKIVVAATGLIARFNPNGSFDPTFGSGGIVTIFVQSIAIQSDGKILVGGTSFIDFGIARLNPNGTFDPTFGAGGQVTTDLGGNDSMGFIGIQSDSKIVAAGRSNQNIAVVRYNTNGSLDPTFGSGGIVTTIFTGAFFSTMAIQSDDKILLGGTVQDETIVLGGDSDFAMLRYNPNGSPDPTFGSAGQVDSEIGDREFMTDLAVQPNGRIVAVGNIMGTTVTDFTIVRYNPNGTPDTTFGTGGIVITDLGGVNDTAFGVTIQPDGFIVVSGTANDDFAVARYEGDLIVNSCNRFTDVFEDGVLDLNWTYVKPAWNEVGGNLVGTPTGGKAEVIATPVFAGCTAPCTVQTILQTAGGLGNKIFFFGWFQDKQNTIELLMKEENDKWVLKQRSSGGIVAKTKVLRTILPNVPYDVKLDFDGTTFTLSIDNIISASMTAGAAPSGTVGYRVKKTTGRFASICVN